MLDPETFLTEVSVAADDFCTAHLPAVPHPGPTASLTVGEVVTLAVSGQWARFPAEAAVSRHACKRLRPLVPTLPSRSQFNRLVRRCGAAITAVALPLGRDVATHDHAYEVVDGTGLVTRNAKRRGAGWVAGLADIGWCTRLGGYEGVRLLASVTPGGAITGWGIGPASSNDRTLAATCCAVRADPDPRLPSVGRPVSACYVTDMGFSGTRCQARWAEHDGAHVVCPPQTGSKRAWRQPLRTWLAGMRQVIAAVNDRLLFVCGLDRERPHDRSGLLARLAAAVGVHNFCCRLNRRLGRGDLEFADLIDG